MIVSCFALTPYSIDCNENYNWVVTQLSEFNHLGRRSWSVYSLKRFDVIDLQENNPSLPPRLNRWTTEAFHSS